MRFQFAPLEGITNSLFRNTHRRHFAPLDQYFTPFLVPNSKQGISVRDQKDLMPEQNQGLTIVPQLLTNQSEDFLKAAKVLQSLGYEEVNLNLGCPSGTVVSKGRGAGQLADPERLYSFLDEIFSACPISISIKTRIGMEDPAEFETLLPLYNTYPLKELIIHPRLRRDYYKNHPNLEVFEVALRESKHPVGYSGDLFSAGDVHDFMTRFPQVQSVMLGRGLIGNPALHEQVLADNVISKDRLFAYHQDLYAQYQKVLFGTKPVLHKMKELWHYMICLFDGHDKHHKRLRKTQTIPDYEAAVLAVFRDLDLAEHPAFRP